MRSSEDGMSCVLKLIMTCRNKSTHFGKTKERPEIGGEDKNDEAFFLRGT